MAITANSIDEKGIRPAFLINGNYPVIGSLNLWVTESDSYPSGGVVGESTGANFGNGGAGTAGELGLLTTTDTIGELLDDIAMGCLGSMSPRRQDLVPLTTALLPTAALPNQRTFPAAITPDFTKTADEEGGQVRIYPFLPGAIFAGHLVNSGADAAGGSDHASAAADMLLGPLDVSFSITATGAQAGTSNQIQYATRADICVLATGAPMLNHAVVLGFVNPQPRSWPGGVLGQAPGPFVLASTTNSLVYFSPVAAASIWF